MLNWDDDTRWNRESSVLNCCCCSTGGHHIKIVFCFLVLVTWGKSKKKIRGFESRVKLSYDFPITISDESLVNHWSLIETWELEQRHCTTGVHDDCPVLLQGCNYTERCCTNHTALTTQIKSWHFDFFWFPAVIFFSKHVCLIQLKTKWRRKNKDFQHLPISRQLQQCMFIYNIDS